MKTDRRKEITKARREFLEWLLVEDTDNDSPLFGILKIKEHIDIRAISSQKYYYLDERAKLVKIINEHRGVIIPEWTKYNKDKDE